MAHETEAVIGLGANLGNPEEALGEALRRLSEVPGVRVVRVSSLYRTAPIDATGPDYTNAAAVLAVTIPAKELLHAMQKIELDLGRVAPRGFITLPGRSISISSFSVTARLMSRRNSLCRTRECMSGALSLSRFMKYGLTLLFRGLDLRSDS